MDKQKILEKHLGTDIKFIHPLTLQLIYTAMDEYKNKSWLLLNDRCKKLEFMVEHGLGWKDMENDHTPDR